MNNDQIALVQETFSTIRLKPKIFAQSFYTKLFELAPSVENLFRHDMAAQERKLVQTLEIIVIGLDIQEVILPAIRELGKRHVGYGVQPEHYGMVAVALLWTLEQHLAEDFNPDVKDAWIAAYTWITDIMKEAATEVAVTPHFATLIRPTSPATTVADEVLANSESTAAEVVSNGAVPSVPSGNSSETRTAVAEPLVAVNTFGKTLAGPWGEQHSDSPEVMTNGMVVAGQISEREKQLELQLQQLLNKDDQIERLHSMLEQAQRALVYRNPPRTHWWQRIANQALGIATHCNQKRSAKVGAVILALRKYSSNGLI